MQRRCRPMSWRSWWIFSLRDGDPTQLPARMCEQITMAAANDYVFVTHWRVQATVDEVLTILDDAEGLARWWPSVYLAVRKNHDGVVDLYTRGWLPYRLRWHFRVTQRKPNGFILEAWGDLVGRGEWTLTQNGGLVDVVYDWRV